MCMSHCKIEFGSKKETKVDGVVVDTIETIGIHRCIESECETKFFKMQEIKCKLICFFFLAFAIGLIVLGQSQDPCASDYRGRKRCK